MKVKEIIEHLTDLEPELEIHCDGSCFDRAKLLKGFYQMIDENNKKKIVKEGENDEFCGTI